MKPPIELLLRQRGHRPRRLRGGRAPSPPATPARLPRKFWKHLRRSSRRFTASGRPTKKWPSKWPWAPRYHRGPLPLVTMKHVGLNVAADPLYDRRLYRRAGGLVADRLADDPGMASAKTSRTPAITPGLPKSRFLSRPTRRKRATTSAWRWKFPKNFKRPSSCAPPRA